MSKMRKKTTNFVNKIHDRVENRKELRTETFKTPHITEDEFYEYLNEKNNLLNESKSLVYFDSKLKFNFKTKNLNETRANLR